MSEFRFKKFIVRNELSAMKVNTDGVLLGAAVSLENKPGRILDVGTGTGSIALIIAQRISDEGRDDFNVVGIDIDGPSAQEAALNFAAAPWAGHLSARHSSLRDFVNDASWDLIVSNPPYYAPDLQTPDLRRNAARHANVAADGDDSLSYAELISYSARYLSERGKLALILPADQQKELFRCAKSFGLYPEKVLYVRTTERKKPSRIVVTFSLQHCDTAEDELVILRNGEYSEEYRALTGDFYL